MTCAQPSVLTADVDLGVPAPTVRSPLRQPPHDVVFIPGLGPGPKYLLYVFKAVPPLRTRGVQSSHMTKVRINHLLRMRLLRDILITKTSRLGAEHGNTRAYLILKTCPRAREGPNALQRH
ncbi:hypothetical protein CGRA01v4_13171 [Colletotrichum graminicola]|nr:hypothetical protein CGRA01v4_13171 [Colletotrichum graminicola]